MVGIRGGALYPRELACQVHPDRGFAAPAGPSACQLAGELLVRCRVGGQVLGALPNQPKPDMFRLPALSAWWRWETGLDYERGRTGRIGAEGRDRQVQDIPALSGVLIEAERQVHRLPI